MSPLTRLYLAFSLISDPLWRISHRRRLKKGKEDAARLSEKYGVAPRARPDGPVLWFHALSVGESLALIPLVERALAADPRMHVVLTTSTATSIAALEKAGLPAGAIHVLLPIDTATAVRRFLSHWRPSIAVFAELDFWPRLMIDTHRRGIPMVLVNSRLSEASAQSRGKLGGMMRDIVGLFDRLLVQDPESFQRFKRFGADPRKISVVGALKSAARPLPADADELKTLQDIVGNRPIWLAAATRDLEEPLMIAAHKKIVERAPNALLIIAPRFLDSADEIEASAQVEFSQIARRSRNEAPTTLSQVYIADTIGEMGLWYRLAPISFVGHSLGPRGKPLGGKNPFEAMALGSVVLHGKAVDDFSETYQDLRDASASILVKDPNELAVNALRLFDREEREPLVKAAKQIIKSKAAVLENTWTAISKFL